MHVSWHPPKLFHRSSSVAFGRCQMRVFLAPVLVFCFSVLGLYGWIVLKFEKRLLEKHGFRMPLCLQAPVLMYFICFCIYLQNLWNMWWHVLIPSHMLDPVTTVQLVERTMIFDHEHEWNFHQWKEAASLEHWPVLRWVSVFTPLWCLGTWCVAAHHTWRHLRVISSTGRMFSDCPQRIRTMCIVALPMIYGIMALLSVQRMWDIIIDHVGALDTSFYPTWQERRRLCLQIFQTNCMVADLYESFALWMFSFVITDVIKVQMYLSMMSVCEDSRSWRAVANLMRSMRKLTTDGVKVFYIACIFNAAYLLMVSFLTWVQYFDSIWLRNKLDNDELHMKADMLFLGLGFSASFAAIGNLMKVEDNFVLELKDFHPKSKFWVTKVLVTLAFLQECLLYFPPLNQLSNTRRDTIYSSALCVECLVISVLHAQAWPADDIWYDEVTDGVHVERLLVVRRIEAQWEEHETAPTVELMRQIS